MKNAAIILAAGQSRRLGLGKNKILLSLQGKPLLFYSLTTFLEIDEIDSVVVVAHQDELEEIRALSLEIETDKEILVCTGGKSRQESVYQGLLALKNHNIDKVLVHDGARPFISADVIYRVIEKIQPDVAVLCAVKVVDSLREVDEERNVVSTVDREKIYAVQTPQGFIYKELFEKHQEATDISLTDDAQLFSKQIIVLGDYRNQKVTTIEDWEMIKAMTKSVRVGNGFDVHPFAKDRELILGGVNIPFEKGLLGHSDADVLVHAIIDALLGSLALGDIGSHFPDTDKKYRDISSRKLLRQVKTLIDQKSAIIENIDATILAEVPKIGPYKEEMRENIALDLDISKEQINIKATTTEKLGFVGRKEGIAVMVVATVSL
ncbi:MAG TPA: 2-C-methyl-D-erythritol 2,4-cyclodiphosphate synthase [Firmicutes bacterium]|nr:2-C-methyl-D-erythritol 2,4-cyclodiphosphate synthase [Bacillota bacterium]